MELDPQYLENLEQHLSTILGPEMAQIIQAVQSRDFLVKLPEIDTVDNDPATVSSLVARTANVYSQAARFAGMARAEQKICKGRYERKYKRSRVGKSDAERDRAAMEACENEHHALSLAEAVAELADSLESAARVSSESIRKIYNSNQAHWNANSSTGELAKSDWSPW